MDEAFLTWIESYLTHRQQAVWIDHCLSEIGEELIKEASKVTQWMLENKLKLNADKTHLLTGAAKNITSET